jgi:thiosulfate dehydrogenase [quinone] large subunit
MLYAGVTKIMNPQWSAAPYLENAKTFTGFFQSLTQPSVLPLINFVNEWGLTLLGISLILGVFVRISAPLGAVLMLLYYFPVLNGWYPNAHSFIVDDHIIYAVVLLVLAAYNAGSVWGLGMRMKSWMK